MPIGNTGAVSPVDNLSAPNASTLAPKRVFMGEVLTAFNNRTLAEKLVHVKTLTSGVSGRFPVLGTLKASDVKSHTPGAEIDLNTIEANERVITINGVEYTSILEDGYESKILDFNAMPQYTQALGYALADKLDVTLFALLYTACTDATKSLGIAGQPDGSWVYNTDILAGTTARLRGEAHVTAILEASATMKKNNVPGDKVYITSVDRFIEIAQDDRILNKFYNKSGENGGIDSFGDMLKIGDIKVMWSNNLTLLNDFEGYLFTSEAIGLVKFISVITEVTYQETRFATLATARYAYGADILNPGCVVGIRSNNDAIV